MAIQIRFGGFYSGDSLAEWYKNRSDSTDPLKKLDEVIRSEGAVRIRTQFTPGTPKGRDGKRTIDYLAENCWITADFQYPISSKTIITAVSKDDIDYKLVRKLVEFYLEEVEVVWWSAHEILYEEPPFPIHDLSAKEGVCEPSFWVY